MSVMDCLLAAGLSPEAGARAERVRTETAEPIPVVVSRLGLLPDDQVAVALAEYFGIPVVDEALIPSEALELSVTQSFLKAQRCLPLAQHDHQLDVAVVDLENARGPEGVGFATGLTVRLHVMGFHAWRSAFDRLYVQGGREDANRKRQGARWTDDAGGVRDLSLDAPAVRRVESLISEAVEAGASDIHIERKPDGTLIRMRIDGRLKPIERLTPSMGEALIARLKVLGDLDVANHRKAQDGRTALSARGRPVDVRLSIIPGAHGEAAVIRLLDRRDVQLDFKSLGFASDEIDRIEAATRRPQGLFIVAGPTGGGKTTTLYSIIHALKADDRKIVTVEDPIEYYFDDVHQTQLDTAAGLTFASALRAFLRHDPDVILVGEIRDAETARTAVQAALTGHLVLSTLHAKSASHVPARLIDMGVEPFLVASTLTATTAQRLVRKLCSHCAEPADAPGGVFEQFGYKPPPNAAFKQPVGCARCRDGYAGRMVISETLTLSDAMAPQLADRDGLANHVPTTLLVDGFNKAALGLTSLDEVMWAVELT